MAFRINDECIGCGACAAICEDVFEIGDDGYAESKDIEVEDNRKEDAISAMEGCPTGAISEKEENKEN